MEHLFVTKTDGSITPIGVSQDNFDARIKAEKDFNKSISDLVKNQSFLAAIDRQDDFVDEEKERQQAAGRRTDDQTGGYDRSHQDAGE